MTRRVGSRPLRPESRYGLYDDILRHTGGGIIRQIGAEKSNLVIRVQGGVQYGVQSAGGEVSGANFTGGLTEDLAQRRTQLFGGRIANLFGDAFDRVPGIN